MMETNTLLNSYLSSPLVTSKEINEITAARIKARTQVGKIEWSGENRGRKYADIEDYIDAIQESIGGNGLLFEQHVLNNKTNLAVTSRITHISGQFVESTFHLPEVVIREFSMQRNAKEGKLTLNSAINAIQEIGSMITYMRRYAIQSIFFIRGEPDTDGDMGNNHRDDHVKYQNKSQANSSPKRLEGPATENQINTIKKLENDLGDEAFYNIAHLLNVEKSTIEAIDKDTASKLISSLFAYQKAK